MTELLEKSTMPGLINHPLASPHFALHPAILRRRYKRFLADILLPDGQEVTVHCPNTGSMKNCLAPDSPCWYSTSDSKTRKYPHTLEIVTTPAGHLAGINTARANALVEAAIGAGVISHLAGYSIVKREVVYGQERSRIDFLLSGHSSDPRPCYVEVKNVTLMEDEGAGFFPDSVSLRGSKHLRELMAVARQGARALLIFCVQHSGINYVSPADHIDPDYGTLLREAQQAGVEVVAYAADLSPNQHRIHLIQPLMVKI